MFARLFRSGLILFAVFAVVWLATILWWQSINRMPTTTDIVTYLLLLPAGMIAVYLLMRRALDGIRANVAAAVTAPAMAAPAAGGDAAPERPADDPARRWTALVLATAQRDPLGADAAATAAAAQAQQRPDVADVLGDGQPIFAAKSEEVDAESARVALTGAFPELDWTDEAVRALALAAEVAERLVADALLAYPALVPEAAPADASPGASHGSSTPSSTPSREPVRLVATLLLPRGWSAEQQAAAGMFVRTRLSALWPAAQITMEPLAARGDGDALLLLDRAIVALHREPASEVRALIAADSLIGTHAIAALRHTNRLFAAQCEHGLTPAEAAAAVLLCAPEGPLPSLLRQDAEQAGEGASPPVLIGRACMGRLDAPTPDKGLPKAQPLEQAVAQAIAQLAPPAAAAPSAQADAARDAAADAQEDDRLPAPAAVVADISPHPVRTVEVARVFSERFPELDLNADLLPVGTPCGHTGVAGTLLAVTVAHQQCAARGAPVLAVSAADPQQRGAIALRPVPPPLPPAAAPATT